MHRALTARWLNRALRISELPASTSVPVFLCPAVRPCSVEIARQLSTSISKSDQNTTLSPLSSAPQPSSSSSSSAEPQPSSSTENAAQAGKEQQIQPLQYERPLPLACHGCGAFSQTHDSEGLGYFDVRQRRVKNWLDPPKLGGKKAKKGDDVVENALKGMDEQKLNELGLSSVALGKQTQPDPEAEKPPLCDRCHVIRNHQLGHPTANIPVQPITIESLRETIEESTHKINHIYHVLDAADFPMSLIPKLSTLLGDIPMRSKNRRSRAAKYQQNRQITLSFIITKGDLLAPTKGQVDKLVPHLREILREALGSLGTRIRLGNVACVSAKRGWWTGVLREAVYKRGGASWLVGKTNVGKSQLFEAIYPKGIMGDESAVRAAQAMYDSKYHGKTNLVGKPGDEDERFRYDENFLAEDDEDGGDLLPPPQRPQKWPEMPVVSLLPGTTASPIRQIFGKGKGELIDLPGLDRSDLSQYVEPRYWSSLVWQHRERPKQVVVKPGQSLILGGGLVRITPRDPMDFLTYNFTPMEEHLTSTEKASEFQAQTRDGKLIKSILKDGAGKDVQYAGKFELRHDMTKQRAGPLTRKNAVGLKVESLPFRVVSLDLLIEGVGYVEIAAQMRARNFEALANPGSGIEGSHENPMWPSVDVYTPEGRFVGERPPINGYLLNKPRELAKHQRSRPRKSMVGERARRKLFLKKRQAQETTYLR